MPKTQFYSQKIEGEVMKWEKPDEVQAFRRDASPGRYLWEPKKVRKPKSQKQLGYIFGGISKAIIHECNEIRQDGVDSLLQYIKDADIPKGQPATEDLVKAIMYAVAPTYDNENRKRTLSGMDTGQASHFTERLLNIFANFVHIKTPAEFKAKLEQDK